jgi:hypothetical protein
VTACSVDGCERPIYCRQMCTMHYQRARKDGHAGSAASRRAARGAGSLDQSTGYRVLHLTDHPLANAQGRTLEHRAVLYDAIGEGPHPCHWCGTPLPWRGPAHRRICVDHLDDSTTNNDRSNLVPSCLDCNTKRGTRRGHRSN